MLTKEELEIEKLKRDLDLSKQPFWKKPAYLTIFATLILGLIGYISTTNNKRQKEIEQFKSQTESLKEENRLLELNRLRDDASFYERKYAEFKELTQNKKNELNQLQERYDRLENDFDEKLEIERNRINRIYNEADQYAKNYANGFVKGSLENPIKKAKFLEVVDASKYDEFMELIISLNEKATVKAISAKKRKLDEY